jgi:hypothetical protein
MQFVLYMHSPWKFQRHIVLHSMKMQEGIFNSVPKDRGPHTSILGCAKAPLTLSTT